MNGAYAYTKDFWLPLTAATFVATLGLYTWRRRDVPASKPFLVASVFGSLLLLSIALETAAVPPAAKISWYHCQYALQMLAVTAGTSIALEYTFPGRWLTRRILALLALPLFLTIATVILAPQLIWQTLWVGPRGTVVAMYTPLGVLSSTYSWGLLIVNAAAFLWLFARSPQHRWPVTLMLCGQISGRIIILLDITGAAGLSGPDLAVLAVLAPWAAYAVALLGFHILDPLPAARQIALAQMREGMIVLDAEQRIASVNSAAAAMLGIAAAPACGRQLRELLPALADFSACMSAFPAEQPGGPCEISFGSNTGGHSGDRWYALEYSPLNDFRGPLVGHLLMLRDVTEQKHARAQLLEQERALATLHERERLARELHDGVTQLLAAAHLQAKTARLLYTRSQDTQLQACLDGLAATTLRAEADLREYLLGVKTTTTGARPLFATLREYLVQFTELYGIPVELIVPAELEEEGLPAVVEVQLVRIIQEALTNVRKHACITAASCHAWVSFALAGTQVRVVVADDGCGFDPAADASAGSRYGLRSMDERAQSVGGSLAVTSYPGQGTQVMIIVPRATSPQTTSSIVRQNGTQAAGGRNGVAS
jgi:PAS domain S-box-containing protein